MIEFYGRLERLGRVATLAAVGTKNMGSVLGGGGDTAATLVAARAGAGSSLEDRIDVTALAGHVVVFADEFEPGSKVVKSATHLSHGWRSPPQPQQPKAGDERLQPAAVRSHIPAPERRCGAAPLNVRVE